MTPRAWLVVAGLLVSSVVRAGEPAAVPGESLYNLTATWTTERGAKVPLSSFRGHPLVFAMVYTSCQASCPLVVSDLKAIEARLDPKLRETVRFVLVSFDPARDTPPRLLAFATSRKLDLSRWSLLTGPADAVRDLAAATGLRIQPTGTGDFLHANIISVVDAGGVVRHQQLGLSQDPEQTLAALRAATR